MAWVTEEEYQAAKQVRAYEYLQTYQPGRLKKTRTRNEWQLQDHDSFKINEITSKWHWKSRGIGGMSALRFLMQVDGMGYTEAVKILCEQTPVYVSRAEPAPRKKPFSLPFPNDSFYRVRRYLNQRGIRAEELEDVLPEYKIAAGVYAPNDEIYGKFHVLLPVNEKTKRTLFELKQIYSGRWDVNERTKERIPSLPEDYLVSKEAEEILQMVDKTPARLFMMTGDAGTGKTTDARMIAQILGLPYYVFTCGPGTDELELLATTVPNMGGTAHLEMELPRLEDIEMDPASALATVNGIYEEGISREKAFQEILKAVYEKGYEKSKNEKDFLLKESEIVKACREPSVIEIQEPAMIEKPGTLTRLNSLFDDGAVTDLVNGEQIRRNPDTIVIMTTNLDYVGCQNFNQSVLSRMNLIQPKEALTEEEMAKRAMKRTGFKNKELLSFMAATVCKIHEYLIEQDITDGVCGYRELENWVLSYMVSNDLRRSAWTALLSKASMDREEQETMERVFLLPHCDVD